MVINDILILFSAKSVPSSPMVKRAFSRLGTLTAGWGRSFRGKQQLQLTIDDKKKWSSSHDCSSKFLVKKKSFCIFSFFVIIFLLLPSSKF